MKGSLRVRYRRIAAKFDSGHHVGRLVYLLIRQRLIITSLSAGPETAYEKLLTAARVLFYNHGISGTGIDAIVKRAGVAKKSLYNNFASKDELVAAYLRVRHEEWLSLYKKVAWKWP